VRRVQPQIEEDKMEIEVEQFEVEFSYRRDTDRWHWRLLGPRGEPIALSGQGYETLDDARRIAYKLFPPADLVYGKDDDDQEDARSAVEPR
jgi:hypothetical protein